jgi:hypothetical protein
MEKDAVMNEKSSLTPLCLMGDVDWVAKTLDWTVTDQPNGVRFFDGVENQVFPTAGAADVIYVGEATNDSDWRVAA